MERRSGIPSAPDMPTDSARALSFIEKLAAEGGVSFTYLGRTVLGKGIPILTVGDPFASEAYLYVGAHHAMEHITSSALLAFAHDLTVSVRKERVEYGEKTSELFGGIALYIVPMLNRDGVDIEINGADDQCPLAGRLIRMNGGSGFEKWQANARGVDLNHNYDAGFYEYKEIERSLGIRGGGPTRFSGEYPESEPEVGALCNFLRFNENVRACLTLHTQGEEIYYGDASRVPDAGKIAASIAAATGYRVCRPEGPALYGGMTDWVTSALGKPCFTVECGRGENPLPSSDFPGIYARIRRLLFTFPSMFR